jgi:hypothetical protein
MGLFTAVAAILANSGKPAALPRDLPSEDIPSSKKTWWKFW